MIDFDQINKLIEQGYINSQVHPNGKLTIYNYSQKTQFEQHWTPETKACRGLIVDSNQNIVARPFPKFFNYDQLTEPLPDEPFQVFEKLDGSLGIMYWVNREPFIATRGSFISEQAQRATSILRAKYSHVPFNRELTYLFEIIYPENRIIVDYGATEDIFLLAAIDTETGEEIEPPPIDKWFGLPLVGGFKEISNFSELLFLQERNKEGFVVRFKSGLRVKVKFAEYLRLHKLLTRINARHIWEVLKDHQPLTELLESVPDEYYTWIKEIELNLNVVYTAIEQKARQEFKVLGDRKETAAYFNQCTYPSVMFAMLDNRDYSQLIWKRLRPENARTFKTDIDG